MSSSDTDMGGWTDLLHSSNKLLEQATPSTHFPTLQRNLDQLEVLSKKLKTKTLRTEAPRQSIAATRLLAREGINAEQLTRDLKSFELKVAFGGCNHQSLAGVQCQKCGNRFVTTFEDVFPSEATTVEEYLQQVHEMAMISAIQEAQKDNLRNFDDYMMRVLEEDWQKEKRDFLQSLGRLSSLPRSSSLSTKTGISRAAQLPPSEASRSAAAHPGVEVPLMDRPLSDQKASVYAEVLRKLNDSRERGLPFNPARSFGIAFDNLGLNVAGGKSVNMQKIWHLVQALLGEGSAIRKNVANKMSLVIGARQHLEWGHEKYILDTIQSHPAQAALGGAVGNLQKIRAFLRVRLRDHGVLDFDSTDVRRQPPVDTTWQQIYFCLRTGYYDESMTVAHSSHVAGNFAPKLSEWISNGGLVSHETAVAASEECEKMLRLGDRAGRMGYDKKKLLLYAILSGCRRQIDRLLRDFPTLFSTIEDFLWFKLAAIRDLPSGASSIVLSEGFAPYSLEDLQIYLNKFEPSHYTKNGKDPLVYPYVLLLSIQLLPAILYLSKEIGDGGYDVDAIHIAITFSDHGVLSEGAGPGHKLTVMDIYSEVASIIRQYGTLYLSHGNLSLSLEYYAQAAATMGGGRLSWTSHENAERQRQRTMMLNQLLTEILLCEGGIPLLLGPRGTGEEGSLRRFLPSKSSQQQFLLEAANQCLAAGLYDKSIEIHKRVGAYAMALETINKCLSDAISAFVRGKLDGESRTASLIQSGNVVVDTYKYSIEDSIQERGPMSDQQTTLRQLEAILNIHKLARSGKYIDALREITKLSFLPLDPRAPETVSEVFQHLSPHVQACVTDLLKLALSCLDNVRDADHNLRILKSKISNFVANNMTRNWPNDLYEKIAQSL